MQHEFGQLDGIIEHPYTEDQCAVLARVNPVFGEVHDGEQMALATFTDDDTGERRGLEIRPFYMNRGDRTIDVDQRYGIWQMDEYDGAGQQICAARVERLPGPQGLSYRFTICDGEAGQSRPASSAEATHLIRLLGGMAATRERAIATGEYPLSRPRSHRRRGILPALEALLRR